jgi:FlgD Ig-like domain
MDGGFFMNKPLFTMALLTFLLGLGGMAPAQTIDDIQSYDPLTGVGNSPYDGQTVTLTGEIYLVKGTLNGGTHYFRDGTGGISFYDSGAVGLEYGTQVEVTGTVGLYVGEYEISGPTITVTGSGPDPTPMTALPEEVLHDYEYVGDFVSVVGEVVAVAANSFNIAAADSSFFIDIDSDTGIDLSDVQVGDIYQAAGACVNYNGLIEIKARRQSDLVEMQLITTRYISESGDDNLGNGSFDLPFASLQRAIDASADGDTVLVFDGTYTGAGNQNVEFADKLITILSQSDDFEACIFNLEGADGIHFQLSNQDSSGGLNLGGISFRGGDVAVSINGFQSGGPPVNAVCQMRNCLFENNVSGYWSVHTINDIQESKFTGNTDYGFKYLLGQFSLEDCHFEGNGVGINGYSVSTHSICSNSVFVRNGCGIDVGAGAKKHINDKVDVNYQLSFNSCRVDSNSVDGFSVNGACTGSINFTDCQVRDNFRFGGVANQSLMSFSMIDCEVSGNGSHGLRLFGEYQCSQGVLSRVLVEGNGGLGIELPVVSPSNTHILVWLTQCTISNNSLGGVGGEGGGLSLSNTIIAFNTGFAVDLAGSPVTVLNCCNLFGNSEGDWVGPIGDQQTLDNNMSLDPLFCGDDNPDDPYALKYSSPCGADNTVCGQIGARGVGFFDIPIISSITDVGNDQGKQARLIWRQSEYDNPGTAHTITGYGIYREQGAVKNASRVTSAGDKLFGWDYITTVPSRQDSIYQYVAATLCDSTINDGLCLSTFMISAMTSDPGVYFDSRPDSGYSVDNLSPAEPENLVLSYASTENHLSWDSSSDSDFSHFLAYRSLIPAVFSPESAELLGTTIEPTWTDAISPEEYAWGFRYWIVAVDFSGNRSVQCSQSEPLSDVQGIPTRTALQAAVPNPFNPMTTISYDLSQPATVNLRIFDMKGQLVRTLLNNDVVDSGHQEVVWRGHDDSGRQVAAGVYFYRLDAGEFSQTKRMVLVK